MAVARYSRTKSIFRSYRVGNIAARYDCGYYVTHSLRRWCFGDADIQGNKEYCEQNGIEPPTYTRYMHRNGCRYEVEVAGFSCFGTRKFYETATEAIYACAHNGLYSVLVSNINDTPSFPGASLLLGKDPLRKKL